MDVRKDRLRRLKEGFITKERFEELDRKSRDLKVKKRSKIIKEVNQENEEEIFQKILRRKRQMEIDEENKVTNMRNLTKKPKDKFVDTQANVRDAGTESPNEEENNIMVDLEEEKQLMRSKNYKKKNSFWCSSTFCIPCTRRVVRERNIINKEDSKKDDIGNSFTKTIVNNESLQPNRAKSQKVIRTEESYKNDLEDPPTIAMKKTPVPNQETSIEYIERGRGRSSNTPHLNHQNRRDEITHTPEILNSFERNLENSQSNRSAGSTIVENRVGFKHEEMSPYNYSLSYNKKGRLQPLTKQNNFVAKPSDNFMHHSFNRNTSRMDMVYKKSDDSLKESRNSMEQDLPNPYGMSQIEEESPSFYTKNQG